MKQTLLDTFLRTIHTFAMDPMSYSLSYWLGSTQELQETAIVNKNKLVKVLNCRVSLIESQNAKEVTTINKHKSTKVMIRPLVSVLLFCKTQTLRIWVVVSMAFCLCLQSCPFSPIDTHHVDARFQIKSIIIKNKNKSTKSFGQSDCFRTLFYPRARQSHASDFVGICLFAASSTLIQ